MKILGRTGSENNKGYIVELTEDEISKLMGYGYTSQMLAGPAQGKTDRDRWLSVGSYFPVSEWWDRIESVRSNQRDLEKTAKTLRGLADLIEGAWPAVEEAVEKGASHG